MSEHCTGTTRLCSKVNGVSSECLTLYVTGAAGEMEEDYGEASPVSRFVTPVGQYRRAEQSRG